MGWLTNSIDVKGWHVATLAIVLAVMAGGIVWNYHEVRQLPEEIREERLAIEAAVDRLEGLTKRLEQINVAMHAEGGDAYVLEIPESTARELLRAELRRQWEESVDARLRTAAD